MNRQLSFVLFFSSLAFGLVLSVEQNATAQQVTWHTDFNGAAQRAKQLNKPLLVEVGASWCPYCTKMQRETLRDAHIAERINACFIPVALDADRNKRLVRAMGVRSLPTTVIVSPKMHIVRRITGYQSPHQLDNHLEGICQHQ